jgi:hypothetical protein
MVLPVTLLHTFCLFTTTNTYDTGSGSASEPLASDIGRVASLGNLQPQAEHSLMPGLMYFYATGNQSNPKKPSR